MADDRLPLGPLEALSARGLTAKREYVRGLEQRKDAEALSLLVECLCDESWFLRDLAEQAFVRLGEEHAGQLLVLLTGGLWYTRLSAARLLGRLGYRPAVPALLDLCADPNETASLAARDAVVAVARLRGATRVAHALQRLSPERRRDRMAEIAQRDRAVAKTIERLMANAELMGSAEPDRLVDPEEVKAAEAAAPRPGGALPFLRKPAPAQKAAATTKPAAPLKPAAAPRPAPAPQQTVGPKPPVPKSSPAVAAPAQTPAPRQSEGPTSSKPADAAAKPATSAEPPKPTTPAEPQKPASASPKPTATAAKPAADAASAPKESAPPPVPPAPASDPKPPGPPPASPPPGG